MTIRSMFLVVVVLAVCSMMSACTHKPYHPFKDDREWADDHAACEKYVREGIRDNPITYNAFDEMRLIKECMKSKGWKWERTSLLDFNQDQSQ